MKCHRNWHTLTPFRVVQLNRLACIGQYPYKKYHVRTAKSRKTMLAKRQDGDIHRPDVFILYHAWGLKIRLTSLPLTTMDLTSCIPSASLAILGSARAAATTSSSEAPASTTILAFTLPPT